MNTYLSRRTAPLIEPLENRIFLSAALHPAFVADAKITSPGTTTAIKVKSGELGQSTTFSVTVKNTSTGGAPAGTVDISVDGTDFQTLTLKSKGGKTATATYAIPAGGGGTDFYFGSHSVSATYTSTDSLPTSSASGTFTIKQPKFKTESGGLEVATVAKGRGASIREDETASMLYTGYLYDGGTIFDDSDAHGGTPFQFTVEASPEQVITGFDEGTVGMKVGETRVLIIPSTLGYGAEGSPPTIPANAELVFLITLTAFS